jgi:aconitase A
LTEGVAPRQQVAVVAANEDGSETAFTATVRIDGVAEAETFASGGLLRMVLQQLG